MTATNYSIKFFLSTIFIILATKTFCQSLQQPFIDSKLNGTITIYDYNNRKWITNDIEDSNKGTLPASTFKILNTLILLEAGVVADENEIVKWPGHTDTTKYGYRPDIYHDMNLQEAFKLSAGWVYVELAKNISKEKYRQFLTSSHYGNADVSIDDPDFWNFGELKISPANQIEILVGVYDETLPFSKRSFSILKKIMKVEERTSYVLRAKTGWTRDNLKDIGWWVGYIESEGNIFFFATRLIKDRKTFHPEFRDSRISITRKILSQLDIID
jgi:beta-lactamase class D